MWVNPILNVPSHTYEDQGNRRSAVLIWIALRCVAFEQIGVNPILRMLSHTYDNLGDHKSAVFADSYVLKVSLVVFEKGISLP